MDRISRRVSPSPTETRADLPPGTPISVPSGTKIPLTLKQGINTRSARPGDPVYAQTAFPVTQNDQIVIPAGTFVQGEIRRVVRPGRVKGRAELQMDFTSMIFPNGYTVMLPGAVQNTPGSENNTVSGQEGTIKSGGAKARMPGPSRIPPFPERVSAQLLVAARELRSAQPPAA